MRMKTLIAATAAAVTLGAVAPAMAFTSQADAVSSVAVHLSVPKNVAAEALASFDVNELSGPNFDRDHALLIALKPANTDLTIQDVREVFQLYGAH